MAKDEDRKIRGMFELCPDEHRRLLEYTNRKVIKNTLTAWGEGISFWLDKKIADDIEKGIEVSDEEKYLTVVRATKERIRKQEQLNIIASYWDDQEQEKYFPMAEKIGLDTVEAQEKSALLKKSGDKLLYEHGDAPQTKQEKCDQLVKSLYLSKPRIERKVLLEIVIEKGFAEFNLKRSFKNLRLVSEKDAETKILYWCLPSMDLSELLSKNSNEEQGRNTIL